MSVAALRRLCTAAATTALSMACWAGAGAAATIDFEDRPAANDPTQTLGDEYAGFGIHFQTTDDGATWSGMAGGDPGLWSVNGSQGPAFLGFDGRSYEFAASFDAPVTGFRLDVSRAAGGVPFLFIDQFTLVGLRAGAPVEQRAVFLTGVDSWQTVALSQEVDRVVGFGQGLPGFRFAVDNLQWVGAEAPVWLLDIDVRPGSDENPIRIGSRGVVPVAVFGSDDLDVTTLDPDSLVFGPGEAPVAHRRGPHYADLDGDGHLDLLSHHRTRDAGLLPGDEEACLYGESFDGEAFEGCDAITLVPGR